jgi:hypothetical protein
MVGFLMDVRVWVSLQSTLAADGSIDGRRGDAGLLGQPVGEDRDVLAVKEVEDAIVDVAARSS